MIKIKNNKIYKQNIPDIIRMFPSDLRWSLDDFLFGFILTKRGFVYG